MSTYEHVQLNKHAGLHCGEAGPPPPSSPSSSTVDAAACSRSTFAIPLSSEDSVSSDEFDGP